MNVRFSARPTNEIIENHGLAVGGKVQKFIDNECLRRSDKYTPKRTGELIRSGTRGTVIGTGRIVYIAPYARSNYYYNGGYPATELMKCRRYYRTVSRGTLAFAVDAASVVFVDPFEIPMRIDPTAKILSPVVLNYCNGWLDQPDVTKMSIVSTNLTKMGACYIHVSGFNVTVGGTEFAANYPFRAATDNFIGFDAEIY